MEKIILHQSKNFAILFKLQVKDEIQIKSLHSSLGRIHRSALLFDPTGISYTRLEYHSNGTPRQ